MDMFGPPHAAPDHPSPIDGKCRVCGSTELTTRNRFRPCNRKPCNRKKERERRAKEPEKRRARDAARSREWRRANPGKLRAQLLRQNYGLHPEQCAGILRAQNDACAICLKPSTDYCVDRCHATRRKQGAAESAARWRRRRSLSRDRTRARHPLSCMQRRPRSSTRRPRAHARSRRVSPRTSMIVVTPRVELGTPRFSI